MVGIMTAIWLVGQASPILLEEVAELIKRSLSLTGIYRLQSGGSYLMIVVNLRRPHISSRVPAPMNHMPPSIISRQIRQRSSLTRIKRQGNNQEIDASKLVTFCKIIWNREKKIKANLPYHINLIDLLSLKASEPKHSLIFFKLLKQKKRDEFQILNKFIKYLGNRKAEFRKLKLENPEIDREVSHIDIWVRDYKTGNALIIENKIHDAPDQREQLSRYINATKGLRHKNESIFKDENIYIVYMPSDGGKEPADQSWGDYKDGFENRYITVTFRELLQWLKNELLHDIKRADPSNSEVFLRSALEQYIDHLEGDHMYQSAKRYDPMKKEVKKLIREKLELAGQPADDLTTSAKMLDIITQRKADLKSIMNYLGEIEAEEMFKNWEMRFKEKYGRRFSRQEWRDANGPCHYLNISFPQAGSQMAFNVSVVMLEPQDCYYGITTMEGRLNDKGSIIRRLNKLNIEDRDFSLANDDELLCYAKSVKWDDADKCFGEIIDLVKEIDGILRENKYR
jgi:hypothetical protein